MCQQHVRSKLKPPALQPVAHSGESFVIAFVIGRASFKHLHGMLEVHFFLQVTPPPPLSRPNRRRRNGSMPSMLLGLVGLLRDGHLKVCHDNCLQSCFYMLLCTQNRVI